MNEWHPIETAPKMKVILLFAVTDRNDAGKASNWKMDTGYYSEGHDAWIWEGHALASYEVQPTHWQSLPSAPVL